MTRSRNVSELTGIVEEGEDSLSVCWARYPSAPFITLLSLQHVYSDVTGSTKRLVCAN